MNLMLKRKNFFYVHRKLDEHFSMKSHFKRKNWEGKKVFMSLNYIFQSIRMFYIFSSSLSSPFVTARLTAMSFHATMTTRKCIKALSIVIHNAWSREKTFVSFRSKSICLLANECRRWALHVQIAREWD